MKQNINVINKKLKLPSFFKHKKTKSKALLNSYCKKYYIYLGFISLNSIMTTDVYSYLN